MLLLGLIYLPFVTALDYSTSYNTENLFNQILRTGINWLAVYGYLRFSKEKPSDVCGYLAALYMLIYMVAFNLRQALRPYLITLSAKSFEWAMLGLILLLQWGLVYLAYRMMDLKAIRHAPASRWAIVVIPILVELYFKWSLIAPPEEMAQRTFDTVFYTICATFGVFALVILFERNIASQQKQNSMQMEQLQMQYEMQNAKRALQTNTDIRRLHHDMKNHLLALESMMSGGEDAQEYLKELYSQLEDYETVINTGNSVADALLAEKAERARLDGIRFNICVDLKPFDFLKSIDLVTILGNAIDNAVEALQMLPEGQERIVYMKTTQYANLAVLRISNQFAGKLQSKNGILKTGKADSEMHGIGLSSIQKAAKRYGGTVETQFDNEEGWFRLVVMLPIPE